MMLIWKIQLMENSKNYTYFSSLENAKKYVARRKMRNFLAAALNMVYEEYFLYFTHFSKLCHDDKLTLCYHLTYEWYQCHESECDGNNTIFFDNGRTWCVDFKCPDLPIIVVDETDDDDYYHFPRYLDVALLSPDNDYVVKSLIRNLVSKYG